MAKRRTGAGGKRFFKGPSGDPCRVPFGFPVYLGFRVYDIGGTVALGI